jgi:hypothetical protein
MPRRKKKEDKIEVRADISPVPESPKFAEKKGFKKMYVNGKEISQEDYYKLVHGK